MLRVSFGKKEVADKVTEALKNRGIKIEQVSLMEEFFADVAAESVKS